MKFLIVFDNSGDSIVFDALNSETYKVLEYYVGHLDLCNNNKFTANNFQGVSAVDSLDTCLKQVNKLIGPITEEEITIGDYSYYLDQQVLNKIHADWVRSQDSNYAIHEKRNSAILEVKEIADRLHKLFSDDLPVIKLRDALAKLDLTDIYSDVNTLLHRLETQFNKIRFQTDSWLEFKNPFDKSLLTNSVCNFRISFNHLGRLLYNKWENFDTDLEFDDENTFDQLLGFVDIGLTRTQTISLSPEYVSWCKLHNKVPSGEFLNIGNILDLDKKLNECRIVLYNNIRSGNSFSIKLNKG